MIALGRECSCVAVAGGREATIRRHLGTLAYVNNGTGVVKLDTRCRKSGLAFEAGSYVCEVLLGKFTWNSTAGYHENRILPNLNAHPCTANL